MWQFIQRLIYNPRTLLVLFIIGALFISIQLVLEGTHAFVIPPHPPRDIMNQPELMKLYIGKRQTEYNNYLIFKHSWFHLFNGSSLYTLYPDEQWDFFKYSPTFAMAMGAIAWLPDVLGLIAWNLLNGLTLYFAVRMLPFSNKSQALLMWFIGNELLTSFSNTQSNALMCGLMLAAYACMQRDKVALATLWILMATFIKVYGAVGFCLILFYPGKLRFLLWSVMWAVVLAALPLLVTPLHTLVWQYENWVSLMKADASSAVGLSVAGCLEKWFGYTSTLAVTIVGVVLFLIPFIRFRLYRNEVYKLLMLASAMIWVIIFNHKAESSTYIIAVTGVGIWFFARPAANWRTALLLLVLVFTSISVTDMFPDVLQVNFIKPFKIKAVPCIIVWAVVWAELMFLRSGENSVPVRATSGIHLP